MDKIDYCLPRFMLNEYREQHIYRVTLLLREYTFIYLPHGDGLSEKI